MPLVLIIDSDAEVAGTLSAALEARGLTTKIIGDGADGLNAAKDDQPDLIVLCVELSRVSGYSICNKLKKSPDLAKIPLILTSDKATEETFEQHKKLKTRAEQYLKKPYDLDQMLGLVAQYVDLSDGDDADAEADAELEVSMDDVDVEGDGGMEAAFEESSPAWSSPARGGAAGATQVMQLPDDFAAQMAEEAARADALKRAMAERGPAKPTGAVSSAASEVQDGRLRDEVKQLRQKVQSLERQLQEKEQEFTDRLLQESTRSRDSIELKKKLNQVEREIDKYKQNAERAELRAAEAEVQLREMRGEMTNAGQAKDQLSDKVGQLVDKVKSLAAERDQLRSEILALQEKQGQAEDNIAQAEQVRAKAKKAVDIAMQLLQDTGLTN
jgi:CheY-like chemotaxis protein